MSMKWKYDLAEPCREPIPEHESTLGKVLLIALTIVGILLLVAWPPK